MSEPERAQLKSMDVAEDKRQQMAQMFPEVVTETRAPDGQLTRAVDFEKLKAVLGTFSEVLENQKERYGMIWPGKNECLKIIQQPSIATLKPCREESVNFDTTENLFIEGDNLEVLKLLQKAYYGRVKMIYIDPPYNTGREFIYPDKYAETLDTYLTYTGQVDAEGRKFSANTESEGRFHSKWLSMMLPRLYLARNLLREDGVIFISIGDDEISNLSRLCDEIFGEENRLGIACRVAKKSNNKGDFWAPNFDYILTYSKNRDCAIPFFGGVNEAAYDQIETEGPRTGERYQLVRLYMSTIQNRNPDQRYWIDCPDGSQVIPPGKTFPPERPLLGDGIWRWTKSKFDAERDKIVIKEVRSSNLLDGSHKPARWNVFTKTYLKDVVENATAKPNSLVEDFINQIGSHEVGKLGIPFDYPKPAALIRHLFSIARVEGNDIILDFFAGSCSSAQAVIEASSNSASQKFIMVQLPEPCDEKSEAFKAGYKTIADIGKERIRRVIKKLNDEDEGNLDLEGGKKQGSGFRVYKLARSNFKVWDSEQAAKAPETIAKQLELHEQHIDPHAGQEDILYELLLKSGFPLTTKVEKVQMAGMDIFSVADGALLICLEREITKELIKAMAEADPLQVICLDEGFKTNDQLKANAVQTFKARSQGKDKEAGIVFRTV